MAIVRSMPTDPADGSTAYAALLRGVNLGPRAKVAMPELRDVVQGLGHSDVRTYLNSGNVVFSCAPADEEDLASGLEEAIERRFGLPIPCLVRGGDHLREVVAANPFPGQATEGRLVHATFLSRPPDTGGLAAAVPAGDFLPEEYTVGDRVIYLHLPGGIGRSKLAAALSRFTARTDAAATTRNWNTVTKLREMTTGG